MTEKKEKKEKTQDQTSSEKLEHLEEQRKALDMKIEEVKKEAGIGFWNRKTGPKGGRQHTPLGELARGIFIISFTAIGVLASVIGGSNLVAEAIAAKGETTE